MRKILITGGAGFIGSALVQQLVADQNNYVVIVDNLLTGSRDRFAEFKSVENGKFIKCNVNNYKDISPIMTSYSFDYVFHYAAVVGVERTLENPVLVLDDIQGFRNILDLSKNTGVKRIFFSSSSEVYGEPVEFPQNEHTTPLNSKLPYAVVKNVGESFLKSYKQEFDLDYTIFRFFNTYGPKQSTDFVMSRFIRAALSGDDLTVYGDGSQTRTFCYINDNVDVCMIALESTDCINQVLNIGNDVELSILELAQTIIEATQSTSKIVHLPALEEGDMKRRLPDISKMKKLLDRELIPLKEGIQLMVDSGKFN